jgi:glutathione S-transferase
MITLYTGPLSLFSRKVEIALAEKGLPHERVVVPFNQTTGYDPKHPEVLALNPKGQVPVLTDDGLVLYDSTVILEYLEDAYPQPPLYPPAACERARCRLDELFADEIMLAALKPLMHRTGPRAADPNRRAQQDTDALIGEEMLARHYATLDAKLGASEFFGGSLSAADIALFVSVFFSLRLGGPSLVGYERLGAWYRRLAARPAFAAAVAGMEEADRRLSVPVKRH